MEAILQKVEEDISKFETWFTSPPPEGLGEGPLSRYERAILKTFLVHQALGRF